MQPLSDVVSTLAEELQIPGVAVDLLRDGQEQPAFHGVMSIENPLPANERTLFLCGSTTKTFTATAIMRLVKQGVVDVDTFVRTYLPRSSARRAHAHHRCGVRAWLYLRFRVARPAAKAGAANADAD